MSRYASSSPSSLPSDYGLISQYNQRRGRRASVGDQRRPTPGQIFEEGENVPEDHVGPGPEEREPLLVEQERRGERRGANVRKSFSYGSIPFPAGTSLGAGAVKRTRPMVVPFQKVPGSESESLLGQIPRIQEECDEESSEEGRDEEERAGQAVISATERRKARKKIWKNELWILCRYTAPVFGTHLLEYSLVIAPVISLGHLSTTALAASTLGSMTSSVTGFSIIQGFVSCLDTLLPGAWTSPHPELVGLWCQRVTVVMFLTCIPIIAIWLNAERILLLLKQEAEVARLAGIYLRWLTLGLPGYIFNNISRRYFQSQGLFSVPTRIVISVAPINVALNYLLVLSPTPFRLGFIGAPIAAVISINLISLFSALYALFWVPKTAWHPISLRRSLARLGVVTKLGFAGVGQTASEWWSWEVLAFASSFFGPVALAAQSILESSASTSYQAPFSLSVATSVRVGNLLGEGNGKRAEVAARMSLVMTLGIACVLSSVYFFFRHNWAYIFNSDPEVVALVAKVLPLVAMFQLFDGLNATSGGILRARGKQFTGALLNISAYYVIGIPFSLVLAFSLHLGLFGLWVGITIALVYGGVVGVWLCLRTNWEHEVDKVRERIEKEQRMGVIPAEDSLPEEVATQLEEDMEEEDRNAPR